jgi:hypothetical protein
VYGQSAFASSLAISSLDGTAGFAMLGSVENEEAGYFVNAGDLNGDGYADVLVGTAAGGTGGPGHAYVVYGAAGGMPSSLELSGLDGATGFRVDGVEVGDYAGWTIASAGDMNGDGYADLVVGARHADLPGTQNAGAAFVVFGSASGFGSSLDLSALNGANGFRFQGAVYADHVGYSLSEGDFNGDGFSDVIVGARGLEGDFDDQYSSYVVFGSAGGFGATLLATVLDGTNGFRLGGGWSTAAGDVNGDGIDDMIVGSEHNKKVYVVFGSSDGFDAELLLSALDGINGFALTMPAGQSAGPTVSAGGDVNGDGFDDITFAGTEGGVTGYVLYGRDVSNEVTDMGGAGADALAGSAGEDIFVAGRGNDTMTGGGGADVFRGGAGADRIVISDDGFADINGGSGTDTLAFVGGGFALDLSAIASSRIEGIERIDLVAGSGENTLILSRGDILDLSGTSNKLVIAGDGDDHVTVADGTWDDLGEIGGYHVYTLGAARLEIHALITDVTIATA